MFVFNSIYATKKAFLSIVLMTEKEELLSQICINFPFSLQLNFTQKIRLMKKGFYYFHKFLRVREHGRMAAPRKE